MSDSEKHKNDPYGEIGSGKPDANAAPPPIPAATVVLLRDIGTPQNGDQTEIEVLMLRKTSKISFGGMWVFPGGKIDAADYPNAKAPDASETDQPTPEQTDIAARNAASRETMEEANLQLAPTQFIDFAHWTPPPTTPKRFATWFFLAAGNHDAIEVDGGEIDDHRWISPAAALALHTNGEIDLVPPTWVSLYQLSQFTSVAETLEHFKTRTMRRYVTHLAKRSDGVRVAMWDGDAGYDAWNADATGATLSLIHI